MDGNGKINVFAYDPLNRLVSMALSDGKNVSYTYDAVGNRLTMTDWRGLNSYAYDALNRALSVTTPDGKTVGYAYDLVGNRTKLTYPDGNSVQYQSDALNRLTKVTDWTSKSITYTYDPASNLTATALPNGALSFYTYDASNRLLVIANLSGIFPVSAFAYQLDKVGNRTAVVSTAGGFDQYGYDSLYRLTSWTDVYGHATRYTYDLVGNRLSLAAPSGTTNYTYDAADQLLAAGTTTFSYDGNGSQITKTIGATTTSYGWDALNRLVSVAGGGLNTQYQYDGDGNRIRQQVGTSGYQYLNDTATALPVVLNENGPDGNIDYDYGQALISASSSSFQSFYQFDGLGSVSSVTNQKADLAANYAYDPWGQTKTPVAPPFGLDTLGSKNKYRFTGEVLDPNDALVFLRARYYDAAVARFISRDPLKGTAAQPTTMNRYIYGLANPVRYSDSSGLSAIDNTGQVLGVSTPNSLSGNILPPLLLVNSQNAVSTADTLLQVSSPQWPTHKKQCALHDVTCIQLMNESETAQVWSDFYQQQDTSFRGAQNDVVQTAVLGIGSLTGGYVIGLYGGATINELWAVYRYVNLVRNSITIYQNLSQYPW